MRLFVKHGHVGRASSARRRAVRSFIPSAEHLDIRELLAAGPVGMNLSGTLDFVDAMKNAEGWYQDGSAPLTLNANGWPTSDATVLVLDERVNQPWNGPDPNAVQPDIGGTYSLSFQGQATVTPPVWLQIFSVQNQSYNIQTNTTTAQVVVPHNVEPFLELNFSNTVNPASSTGAGVTNVQLLKPGYAANSTQLFTNNYLNALAPFSDLRYLNVDGANQVSTTYGSNNQLVQTQWSQRTLPSYASQETGYNGSQGVAWEYMIALANATNTDMWINVPGSASNDYVTQLANLIKSGDTVNGVTYAGLNPNLKVYVEYSNEVWGGIAAPSNYNTSAAQQEVAAGGSVLNNDGTTSQSVLAARYYLEREMQITNIFRGVIGTDPTYTRIRPVLGWQEGILSFYTQQLAWFETTYGAPSQFFYGMGDAIYFGGYDYSSVNSIISGLATAEAATFQQTSQFTTIATYYGLKNVSYEGGPNIGTTSSPAAEANALAASRDPRIESIIEQQYLSWYAAGGDVANYFDGPYDTMSPQNEWAVAELAQASNPSLSPKYRGIDDVATSSASVVTAGNAVSSTGPTSLPVSSDSMGLSFAAPYSGYSNYWLLNVATAGTYSLTLTTSQTSTYPSLYAPGLVQVSLSDQQVIGTYSVANGQSINLGSLTLKAGLTTLLIRTLTGGYDPSNSNLSYYEFNPSSLVLMPTIQVQGITSPGFSSYGFTNVGAGVDVAQAGNANASATWTFNVTPGLYRVLATWPGASSNAIDVPVKISDGANQVGNLTVNQQAAPVGFSDGTNTWQDLGGPYTVLGSTLTINLYNVADGLANASMIRIQQIQATAGPQVDSVNNGNSYSVLSGNWTYTGNYQASNLTGSVMVASAGNGNAVSSFTFKVSPGLYQVTSIWQGLYGFSTQVPYSIFDGTKLLAVVPVNQSTKPVGYNDGNVTWQTVGSTYTVTGNTLTVQIANASDGSAEAEALRIVNVPNATAPASPGLVYGVGGSTFSETGTWSHLGGDDEAAAGPSNASATWTEAVAPGTYLVSATWPTGSNESTNSTYQVGQVVAGSNSSSNTPTVGDSSFETVQVGSGNFSYSPTGSNWTFSGGSGVSGNSSAFTSGNPSAPQGSQVAFIQNGGSFSQAIGNWSAGSYQLSFLAAQRGNNGSSSENFQVLVDGVVVGAFTPTGTAYQSYTTSAFAVTAGTHTVTFKGLSSGDNTALIDNVSLTAQNTLSLGDSSFETVQVGSGNFSYDPTGSNWTFSGSSGVSGNSSAFTSGNPSAPQGSQVAFIQSGGSFAQTIGNWSAGTYQFSFLAAQRGNNGSSSENFQVLVDGVVVGAFTPTGTAYQSYTTSAFAVTAGTHTVAFKGLSSGDNTALIDNVSLTAQNTPSLGDSSFETVQVGSGNFSYDPTGSNWTFSGSSGVSGNSSAFTSGTPSAPQGSQVAFIQSSGSFAQTIGNWSAGTYQFSFLAAQRGNNGSSSENFQVLVDGVVVGAFTPTGTAYQSYTTSAFTVSGGTHTVSFKGLTTVDNTAFIDNVSLTVQTPIVNDSSFETVQVGSGGYRYDPTGSPWTFSGGSGISGNGSAFTGGNPSAPQGSQVAFIQSSGSFAQTIGNWSAGTYQFSFLAAQRGNNGSSSENFQVLVDGVVVGAFTPTGTSYQSYTTSSFTVSGGTHTVTFKGLSSGDNTAFIDNVSLTENSLSGNTGSVQNLGSATVNQTVTPSSFLEDSINWQNLGTFTVTGSALVIQLNNSTSGATEARGIRIQRLS